MTTVAEIKEAITQLSPEAQHELREWYQQFDAELWDTQLEADADAGRLDALASEALRAYHNGETTEL